LRLVGVGLTATYFRNIGQLMITVVVVAFDFDMRYSETGYLCEVLPDLCNYEILNNNYLEFSKLPSCIDIRADSAVVVFWHYQHMIVL